MSTLNIRIDPELDAELTRLAKLHHRNKSDLARDMLRRRIAVEQFRELRAQLRPEAEALGLYSDEDVFTYVKRVDKSDE